MKIAIVLGTRPEIIKLAPIIKQLNKKNTHVIFTGQHYDYEMSLRFIEQLGLSKPDYSLKITHSEPPTQIGEIITKLPNILKKTKPDTVIVQGDTNTVLAASLASLKSKVPISHVESGLRSFDWRMPEEHNRIACDHLSSYLFAPTKNSKANLNSEHVHGRIFVTGNTVIDAINMYADTSSKKSKLSVEVDDYILMTLHRSENVDNKKSISSIINAILETKFNVIFPAHPRTVKRLKQFNLYDKLQKSKNILLLDSVGYFEMLELMKNCSFIVTDSGGIQEEATATKIRKKVLVARKTTDRPEAVTAGMSKVIGVEKQNIVKEIKKAILNPSINSKKNPYGKGDASQKIIKILQKSL
ncbi:MAG: non-hydrolyzing UDP-N-acetylglucosamine 2-epimerase [Nitrosopumilaceae archaeon]